MQQYYSNQDNRQNNEGLPDDMIPYIRVGFGKRFIAWFLDGILVGTLSALVFFSVGEQQLRFLSQSDGSATEIQIQENDTESEMLDQIEENLGISLSALGVLAVLQSLLTLLYSSIEGLTGASPGKRLLSITVANDDGRRGNRMLFSTRWVLKNGPHFMALIPIGALSAVGSLWSFIIFVGCFAVLSASKQALHDMIVRSAVFHTIDVYEDTP